MLRTSSKKWFFAVGCVLVFLLFWEPLSYAQTDSLTEKVDQLFVSWDKPDSPGCALGIIHDGKLIYARGYGMANLEYNIPITSKSIFRIGSTSKQFAAMCMVLLEEEGKLSLDDSLRKFFPQMPNYAENVTIRHLIHHTSGIRDYLTLAEIAGMRDDDYFSDAEVVDLLARQKELNFRPGEEHLYSNSGYFLLSQIIKKASGKSLREYAEEKIFQPLGMTNTHFHDDHTKIVKNRASGYAPQKGGGFVISMTTLPMTGDGGVFTSVEDLFFWDLNFYDNRLGKSGQALIEKIQTPGVLNSGKKLDYAFGLGIGEHKGLRIVSHGGAFVGFRADMLRFPDQRFSVICLANLSTFNPSVMVKRVADIYLADLFKEESGDKEKTAPDKSKIIKLTESELKNKTGNYYDRERDVLWTVVLVKDQLQVRAPITRFMISPISPTRFVAEEFPIRLEIEFEKNEETQTYVVHAWTEGKKQGMYEPIKVTEPTPEELEVYIGKYYSEELGTAYILRLKKGKLYMRHENPYKSYPKAALKPTFMDSFQVERWKLIFIRNEEKDIIGFKVNAGRVQNILFEKQ
ncbi:MAG: serine hydrolase domain-containing protein [Candidatus Aminicenantaceae bacterium]